MKRTAGIVASLVLAACAAPPTVQPSAHAAESPRASASVSAELQSPIELLDCDAAPSDVGGVGEDVAIDGGGETPEEALATFLANTLYVIPRSGYEALGRSGDRHAYGLRVDGEIKVVVVVSPRFGEMAGAAFTADELRTCPEAEFGAAADFGDERRVWTHETTGAILTDIPGPAHCGWESGRMLHVEGPRPTDVRQYLRDPLGVFGFAQLLETYAEDVALPEDATFSGYRTADDLELWLTPDDRAAYVVTPEGVERWPRPNEPIGCA
jgi:hypothetical protein